jgi:hypothetical protein
MITDETPFVLLGDDAGVRFYIEEGYIETVFWNKTLICSNSDILHIFIDHHFDLAKEALDLMMTEIKVKNYELIPAEYEHYENDPEHPNYHETTLKTEKNISIIKFDSLADEAHFKLKFSKAIYDNTNFGKVINV